MWTWRLACGPAVTDGVDRMHHLLLIVEPKGLRLQHREGRLHCIDGPFIETREMIGGCFLVDCADREAALAARCPTADWATVEVRPMGPCWVRGAPSAQEASA